MLQYCAICGRTLDEPGNFPFGFPKEFKFCCICLIYANLSTESMKKLEHSELDMCLLSKACRKITIKIGDRKIE